MQIAYQVSGERPLDLLLIPGWVSHGQCQWEDPGHAYFLDRLEGLARLIVLDECVAGWADHITTLPDLEQCTEDVLVVLDAVGSRRAVLFGYSEGATMCQVFASIHPDRTAGLITYGCWADARTLLSAIRVPTLVINRVDDHDAPVEGARYLAALVPGARLVELPGAEHLPWAGRVDEVLNAIETFLWDFNLAVSSGGASRRSPSYADPRIRALTRRQRTILELIAQGRSNKEIASRLCLSEHTVHRHLANILDRLGVATRAAAVARMKS